VDRTEDEEYAEMSITEIEKSLISYFNGMKKN